MGTGEGDQPPQPPYAKHLCRTVGASRNLGTDWTFLLSRILGSKLYWYGSGGEILAETDTSGNVQNEYVYFGGKRVAMLPSGGSAVPAFSAWVHAEGTTLSGLFISGVPSDRLSSVGWK